MVDLCAAVREAEESVTELLREELRAMGWEDVESYRVQMMFESMEPVCPTQDQQHREWLMEKMVDVAREMGVPLGLMGLDERRGSCGGG